MGNEEIMEILQDILEDRNVPKNIRGKVEEALGKVEKNTVTSLSEAMYLLDDVSNDINMPEHTRTDIWQAISLVEAAKESLK